MGLQGCRGLEFRVRGYTNKDLQKDLNPWGQGNAGTTKVDRTTYSFTDFS